MIESRESPRRRGWSCWGPLRRTAGLRSSRLPSCGRRTTTTSETSRTRSSTTQRSGSWSSTGMRKNSCWECRQSGSTKSDWRSAWIIHSMINSTPWGGPCKTVLTRTTNVTVNRYFCFLKSVNFEVISVVKKNYFRGMYVFGLYNWMKSGFEYCLEFRMLKVQINTNLNFR